jgi:hypothetical protein
MIAPLLLAAMITRGPVVSVKAPATATDSPATATDSWLCSHVSVFFCPIFPKLGESPSRSQKPVVKPRKP